MWTHLDTASSDGDRLDLYERCGVHMIRVNGWELMNGAHHASEDLLGRLAGLLAAGPDPDLLVGGLGLGFTLAALVETLGARGTVTVLERSGAVIDWFFRHTNPRLATRLPAGVVISESDVADHLGANRSRDVIVLDVDNGPEALSTRGNAGLYETHGLGRAWASLRERGHLLLWSGFEDAGFAERACAAGFSVRRALVALPNRPDGNHVIYVLSRTPIAPGACQRLGLV